MTISSDPSAHCARCARLLREDWNESTLPRVPSCVTGYTPRFRPCARAASTRRRLHGLRELYRGRCRHHHDPDLWRILQSASTLPPITIPTDELACATTAQRTALKRTCRPSASMRMISIYWSAEHRLVEAEPCSRANLAVDTLDRPVSTTRRLLQTLQSSKCDSAACASPPSCSVMIPPHHLRNHRIPRKTGIGGRLSPSSQEPHTRIARPRHARLHPRPATSPASKPGTLLGSERIVDRRAITRTSSAWTCTGRRPRQSCRAECALWSPHLW